MKSVLAALTAFSPLLSMAGSAAPGILSDAYVMSTGVAMVISNGARSGAPACATVYNRFAVDATTAAGKAQLAALLAAFTSGKPVEIVGTGACTAWPDTESINFVHVGQ
jgi:hypothetical protein